MASAVLAKAEGNLESWRLSTAVIEIAAALAGAFLGITASGLGNFMRRDNEASMAVVRLTTSVEHIATEVSLLRTEIKNDRQELYPRLNGLEQRLAVLETRLHPQES